MMVFKRKQIVMGALVVMILVAGYLNWSYKKDMAAVTTSIMENGNAPKVNIGEAQFVTNNDKAEDKNNEQVSSTSTTVSSDTAAAQDNYFAQAKMNRESTRGQALEMLQGIVDNQNSPKESKVKAQNEIVAIAKFIDKEGTIENLIKAKGIKDAVVFINEGTANVVVNSEQLAPSQVAQILDVVTSQTGLGNDKIKIVEKK